MMFDRLLILAWAIAIAFLSVSALGTTHLLSTMFMVTNVGRAADVLFVATTIIVAGLLWYFVPQPLTPIKKVAASLPPLFLLLYFIFS